MMGQVIRLHPAMRVRVDADDHGVVVRVMNGSRRCARWPETRVANFMDGMRVADRLGRELGLDVALPSLDGKDFLIPAGRGRR